MKIVLAAMSLSLTLLMACPEMGGSEDAGALDAGAADAAEFETCLADSPYCADEMLQQLSFQDFVSTGAVTTTQDGEVFTTVIDASAGGMSGATSNPFVYIKFNADGAVKVDIDDETSIDSMDWDLAARRFVVRLNSGDSGASCVSGAEVSGDFASVTSAPSSFAQENIFADEDNCAYLTDSRFAGFDGPDVLLKTFWEMNDGSMCVATTGQVYVLQLADGQKIKLVIDAYYATGQEVCNDEGTAGSASGTLTMRWAWL